MQDNSATNRNNPLLLQTVNAYSSVIDQKCYMTPQLQAESNNNQTTIMTSTAKFNNEYSSLIQSPLRSRPQTALSNLTNQMNFNQQLLQQSPVNQQKSPQHKSSPQSSPYVTNRKSVQLEQENQILKNQVEILKAALLGLCKDKTLQMTLPGLNDNTSSQMVNGNENFRDFSSFALSLISQQTSTSSVQQQQQQTQQQQPVDMKESHFSTDTFNNFKNRSDNYHHQQENQENIQVTAYSPSMMSQNNSPSKMPKQMFAADLSAINKQCDENNNSLSKISICSSPTKSIKRRKRSQRCNSPSKHLQTTIMSQSKRNSMLKDSPNFREQLPLQIQYKKTTTDDTLVFDKSIDLNLITHCGGMTDLKNSIIEESNTDTEPKGYQDSPETNDHQNVETQEEVEDQFECQGLGILTIEEVDRNNTSQIHIKYAKMLEELENESIEQNIQEPIVQIIEEQKDENQLDKIKTFDIVLQKCEDQDPLDTNDIHLKSQMSSQFEQKQYYENELNNLKTELELFLQEEEQIINLITSNVPTGSVAETPRSAAIQPECTNHNQSQSINVTPYSQLKIENHENLLSTDKKSVFMLRGIDEETKENEDDEGIESFQYTQQKTNCLFLGMNTDEDTIEVSQELLLKNLHEVYQQMHEISATLGVEDESTSFIRPIKILSPTNKEEDKFFLLNQLKNRGANAARQIGKSKERQNRTPVQDKEQTFTYYQQQQNQHLPSFVSPIKYDFQQTYNLFSVDKNSHQQNYEKQQMSPPSTYHDKINHLRKDSTSSSHQQLRQSINDQIQVAVPSSCKGKSGNRQNSSSKQQSAQQIRKRQNSRTMLQSTTSKADHLDKSPSHFSVNKLLSNMASDSKQNISPIRHFEYFHNKESSTKKSVHMHQESMDVDKSRMEVFDKLARRQSMAHGLKQQEEPEDDDFTAAANQLHIQMIKRAQSSLEERTNTNTVLSPCEMAHSQEDSDNIDSVERQKIQNQLNERSEMLAHPDKFFGVYDIEKSEQLKIQRNQSIKKAEELLKQFLQENKQSVRPEFISQFINNNNSTKVASEMVGNGQVNSDTQVHETNYEIQEPQNPHHVQSIQVPLNFTEMSFQENNDMKAQEQSEISEDKREQAKESNRSSYELVNLHITPEKPIIQITQGTVQCSQEFQVFETPIQQQQPSYPQIIMNEQNTTKKSSSNQMCNSNNLDSINFDSECQETKIINQRRKSMEHGHGLSSKITNLLIQQKKKNYQPARKHLLKPNEHEVLNSLNQTTTNVSQLQTFSKNSISCDKLRTAKKSLLSKTIEPPSINQSSNFHAFTTPSNNTSKQQTQIIEEPTILKNSANFIDPEILYEQRSKSVIKRREELLKKKQNNTLLKIEAKYHKIEQFKSTRNFNRMPSNHRMNNSQNNETNTSHGQSSTNTQVLQQNEYQQKYKSKVSVDSSSHTPIRAKTDNQKKINKANHAYQSNQCNETLKQSNSKVQIKFEKRRPQQVEDGVMINDFGIEAANGFNQQISSLLTPINNNNGSSKNLIPSSSQSKSSKMVSECSSYRKRQSEVHEMSQKKLHNAVEPKNLQTISTAEKKSVSKNSTCNLIFKQQQQLQQQQQQIQQQKSNLKTNIVNRTIRMGQAKDYNQLKQEHQRLKNLMQSTIELQQEKNGSIANILQSSQSFVATKLSQQPTITQSVLKKKLNHHQVKQQQSEQQQQQQRASSYKPLGSSRSATKIGVKESQQLQSSSTQHYQQQQIQLQHHVSSQGVHISKLQLPTNYNTNGHKNFVQQQIIEEEGSKDNDGQCANCLRLISKGLSTDFCLEHFGTPRYIDD